MTQGVQTEPMPPMPKKKQDRDRRKINAKCKVCKRRMFRDDRNKAYCVNDGATSVGPNSVPKGTVSTAPRQRKVEKDEKKSK